jgi:hypothetical protein
VTASAFTCSLQAYAQPRPQPPKAGAAQPAAQPTAPASRGDLIARGRELFDDQQYEESIQTLSAALLRPGNTKAQKVDVYRLLALNYITLNRKEEAESAVRGLLCIDPEYQLPAAESPRFRDFIAGTRAKWEAEGRPGLEKPEAPPPPPVGMRHTSPSESKRGVQIDLLAKLEDEGHRVEFVELFFRSGTKGPFEKVRARLDAELVVRATIPTSAVKPPLVEYYLQGFDKGGLPVVSRGDSLAPLRVAVPEPKSSGWVLPVAVGGGVVGAAAIVLGSLALAGVFSSTATVPPPPPPGQSTVTVSIRE